MESLKRRLLQEVRGEVRFEEPLKRHTTYRIGGPADILVFPQSGADVAAVTKAVRDEAIPLFVMGSGSNVLIHDQGFRGVVMRLGRSMGQVTITDNTIVAGAGTLLPKLAKMAADRGLSGLEWAGGVPGTVGGAVRMNAGAHGGETQDILVHITAFDRYGRCSQRTRDEMGFQYRQSTLVKQKGLIVAEAVFRLQKDDPVEIMQRMKQFASRRRTTQPLGAASSGSVFRNPPGDFAGRLVEAAGLKGYQVGGAAVSTVHGNFIVNRGGAKAADIRTLIQTIQHRVHEQTGVQLELEVEIVGWDDE